VRDPHDPKAAARARAARVREVVNDPLHRRLPGAGLRRCRPPNHRLRRRYPGRQRAPEAGGGPRREPKAGAALQRGPHRPARHEARAAPGATAAGGSTRWTICALVGTRTWASTKATTRNASSRTAPASPASTSATSAASPCSGGHPRPVRGRQGVTVRTTTGLALPISGRPF
jgi:hypothetical protein